MKKSQSPEPTVFLGYVPFGNFPYAIMEDARLSELLANRYERTLAILERCPKARMTLALTGQTKELVAREFPRTYKAILRYMKERRLELTQCPHTHPQPVLIPRSSLEMHIRKDIEVTRQYYGRESQVFWTPECTWSPALPGLLSEYGATSVYLRQLPVERPVWLRGHDGARVIGFNLGPRPAWTPETSKSQIRKDFESIRSKLKRSGNDRCLMLAFGDDLEMSGMEDEALLHERIFEVAREIEFVKPVLIGEYFKKHKPADEMSFDKVCCWINHFRWWAGDIVDIHQNSQAQAIRRNLAFAESLASRLQKSESGESEKIRARALENLLMIESTEPRGWRPSLDRRLWGYRHSEQGLVFSEDLVRLVMEPSDQEKEGSIKGIPLAESQGIARQNELVEIPLSFGDGLPGEVSVALDGKSLETQMTDMVLDDSGRISGCTVVVSADAAAGSVGNAEVSIKPERGRSPMKGAEGIEEALTLSSERLSLKLDLAGGGAIREMSLDGKRFLDDEESINLSHLTLTRDFSRVDGAAPAKATEIEDGPLFSQVRTTQTIFPGVEKRQKIRLHKRTCLILIEKELVFSHPLSIGAYQPWKQNKTDKDLVIGVARMRGMTHFATTLPCSISDIQMEELGPDELRYYILANDWAALSSSGRAIGLIADGSVSKFDIAYVRTEDGLAELGYTAGSPSQFGPLYNDERHGYWLGTSRFRLFYMPLWCDDPAAIQDMALAVNYPLCPPSLSKLHS